MAAFMQRLFNVEAFLASTFYILVALAIVVDVAAREFFNESIFGIQQIAVYLVIAVAYVGMGLAAGQNKHLRPRFADNWAPASWRLFIERVGDLLAAVLFLFMAVVAFEMVEHFIKHPDWIALRVRAPGWSTESGWRIVTHGIPEWTVRWLMAYGFFSTAFRYAVFFIRPDLKPAESGSTE